MRDIFICLLFSVLAFSSCTNYKKKADYYIQSGQLQKSVIKTNIRGSEKYILYATKKGIKSYDLVSGSLKNIVEQSNVSGWKYVSLQKNDNYLLVISGQYISIWFNRKGVSFNKIIEGQIRESTIDDLNKIVITTPEHARYEFSLSFGTLTKIKSIGEFLTDGRIREDVIYKIFDDSYRNCVFYKPSAFFTGDLYCYDAFTGIRHTYPCCWSIHGMSDDGDALIIFTKKEGEYFLEKIDTYTCKSEIIASGSDISSYQGGYLVKKFDLTEEYYDGNCIRQEKPQSKGLISSFLDALLE